MKLKDILPISAFGCIGTVKGPHSADLLERYILHNKPVLEKFPQRIIAINKLPEASDEDEYDYGYVWIKHFPTNTKVIIKNHMEHMFGAINLEEEILSTVKNDFPHIKYLFKSMDDVLIGKGLFEREYREADVYYLPGFSYESLRIFESDFNKMNRKSTPRLITSYINNYKNNVTNPQTTFSITNVDRFDSYYGDDILDRYSIYRREAEQTPGIKPWEVTMPDGLKLDCESLFGRQIKNLSKECLLTDTEFTDLYMLVYQNKIADPAHKNIMFKELGICHFHFPGHGVFEI